MENEKYPYQKQWEDYRRKARKSWTAWFICIPIALLAILSLKNLPDNFALLPVLVFLFVFMFLGWFSYKVTEWDCPRCNDSSRNKMTFAQMVATDCRNCGLTKYEGSTFKTF